MTLQTVTTKNIPIRTVLLPSVIAPWRQKLTSTGSGTGIEETFAVIKPALASLILERYNPKNRGMSMAKVTEYKTILEDGQWNPDQPDSTIVFGQDGLLKNGQHRLKACTLSGVDLVTRVELGHDNDILRHLDQHFTRTERAQATVLGRDKAEEHDYAAVKFMYQVENEVKQFNRPRYAVFELIDNYYGRDLFKVVPHSLNGRRLVFSVRAPLLLLARHFEDDVREFVRQIADMDFKQGRFGGPGNLVHYMGGTNFLQEKQTYRGKWQQVLRVFKAFSLFREGRTVQKLRASLDSYYELRELMDPSYVPKEGHFDFLKRKNGDDD